MKGHVLNRISQVEYSFIALQFDWSFIKVVS